ncbi:MAG: threonine/serine exporter family protein [Campylobacterales bacterium]|nr:threonine/serine exporter family protein [Campylobacterales bacterium]
MIIHYDPLFAALAALGFAIIFNVPKKFLLFVGITAIIGFAVKSLLSQSGIGIELSTLLGAIVIGSIGKIFSTIYKEPHQIITIASVIPMVPGTFAFKTIISLLDFVSAPAPSYELLAQTTFYAAKTGFILAAIALGVAAPSLLKK